MKSFLLGCCLMTISLINAQECDLTLGGQIIDFHNNQPLEFAEVYIEELNLTYYTDTAGNFGIKDLCPGEYSILVTHEACEPLEVELNLIENKEVAWYLEHHIVTLSNIETIGRQKRATTTQPEHHIHQEEIDKYSASSIGSVLKAQSGISSLETGNSIVKPMIHGMHSSRVIMVNRGVRQEDMEWGVEHAPNIDINALADIRILKGASALRYGGDAIGGIVITETAPLPKKDTLQGSLSATGLLNGRGGNSSLQLMKGFDSPWALQIQGSYKKLGDHKAPRYYLNNSGTEQKAFSGKIKYGDFLQNIEADYSYFDTSLGILKASHLGNLNDLADAINANEPFVKDDFSYDIQKPYQKVRHHLAKIKVEKRFRNFGKWEAQYAFQFNKRQEFDVRNGEVTDIPSMDVELTTHTAETHLRIDKFSDYVVAVGADFTYQQNYTNPATQVKRLIPDYDKSKIGMYASTEFKPNNIWNFSAGLRYDYTHYDTQKYYYKRYWEQMGYDTTFTDHIIGDFGNQWLTHFKLDYHNISAAIGANYKPNFDSEISFNYAFANRAPNPAELWSEGLHHAAVSIELGDVRLNPENAHKFSINYNRHWDILHGFNVNLLGYYNWIKDYIYQVPSGAEYTIRGAFPVWAFQQIDANMIGADLDIDLQLLPKLNYSTQVSWIYGTDKTNDVPLIMMPPMDWQQQLGYTFNGKLQPYISFNTQYVAQQNRVPNYNFSLEVLENGVLQEKTVDISSAPEAYFLVGLEGGFTFNIKNNPLLVQTKIENLANVSYRNYLNRFRYYTDELGRQIQLQVIYKF